MIPSFCRSVPEPDREGDQSNQGEDTEAESYILRVCVLVPTGHKPPHGRNIQKVNKGTNQKRILCQYGLMKIIQEDSPHVKIKENSNQIHELQTFERTSPPLTLFGQKKNKVPSGNQSFRASLSYPSLGPESASNWFPHEFKLYILHEDECPLSDERLPV